MTLKYDPNPGNWRRVHTSDGKFVCLIYVGPGTTPSDAEAELRKVLRLDSIMLRKIPGKGGEYDEFTPPLPFEVNRPGAE
jgi:hypothetical protein